MPEKIKIRYRDFYDVPRIFITSDGHRHYLFDCGFDEELDAYSNHFDVFIIRPSSDDELDESWENLRDHAIQFLGKVPVESLKFDETLRKKINADVLKQLGL